LSTHRGTFVRRMLQHLLLILLSLSLPMAGLASTSLSAKCTMHTTVPVDMSEADACCPDQHQHSETEKSDDFCKNGHRCSGASVFWPSAVQQPSHSSIPRVGICPTLPRTQLATNIPASVWRPPQA